MLLNRATMSPEEDKTCVEGKLFISPAHNVCFSEYSIL